MRHRLLTVLTLAGTACAPRAEGPVSPAAATPPPASALADHTEQMWAWFPGEYSNYEQVTEQKYAKQEPYEHLHQIFMPVEVPALGARVLFVQQHMVGNPTPYRVRIYTLQPDPARGAVRLDIYKPTDPDVLTNLHLEPERAASLNPAIDLQLAEGCSVWWTPSDAGFVGQTDDGTCRVTSARSGKTMVFSDTLLLTEERLHIQDVAHDTDGNLLFGHPEGDPHKLRKLSWYTGWSVVRAGGPNYDREAPQWQVHKGLHMHSEGTRIPLVDADGSPIPYAVELARLTRSGSNTHLLKVTLYDSETDKSVAYAWTDPNAARIGMNLGWAQVGLTREPGTPHYGFDSEETSTVVRELAGHLQGTLSSSAQAARDDDFRSIQLQTCEVAAPGLGTTVLYVEQAVETTLDEPYRQRLYVLEEVDDQTVRSNIYTLADPASFVGLCTRSERRFVHPAEAVLKEGCAVDMVRNKGVFQGETAPQSCPSALRGASFASVAVTVSASGLDSLDRGWDRQGNQVWGSKDGPYTFRRTTSPTPPTTATATAPSPERSEETQ
ncbi:MAG TPA: hypothetical protein DFR83_02225 [Deltaproteobacteria bacterium]|nr:hypothetical protein [Deltaproteobacteria bacterium]